jgi:hypothetical protein
VIPTSPQTVEKITAPVTPTSPDISSFALFGGHQHAVQSSQPAGPNPAPGATATLAAGTVFSTITDDTYVGDATYDNRHLRINGATVVMNGVRSFRNVGLVKGAMLRGGRFGPGRNGRGYVSEVLQEEGMMGSRETYPALRACRSWSRLVSIPDR